MNEIYTIRDIKSFENSIGFLLKEIHNKAYKFLDGVHEPYFNYIEFKPVIKIPKGMEVLNSILANPNQPIHTDLKEVRKGVCA